MMRIKKLDKNTRENLLENLLKRSPENYGEYEDIVAEILTKVITEKDKANENLKEKYGDRLYFLPYGTRAKLFTYVFKYLYLCFKTVYLYFKIHPKVIVTTGTHTAGPMCYLGKIFGSKIVYIETFANTHRKTATGRLIYPIADLFIVQWEEMLKIYPKAVYGGSIY